MIIFLYGQDTYRMREKLKEIIESYKKVHKSGLNLKYFDCQKESGQEIFNNFKDDIRQTSMFKEKKLAVITNSLSSFGFKEGFLKESKPRPFFKKGGAGDVILFYEEGKINEKDSLFKFLKKNAKCQEFGLLGGQKLKTWIKKEFGKYKTNIEQKALEELYEYIGNDLWRMSNEIRKLVSFKSSKKIEKEDIELLVRSKIETDIFRTIDAIAQKNKKQALNLLHKHLEKGDSPLYLLTMINYQFRNLLIIKSRCQSTNDVRMMRINNLSKELKMHPFVVRKTLWQINKFTLDELKKIYQKIFQVDLNIKTGRIEPEMALDLLIAEI